MSGKAIVRGFWARCVAAGGRVILAGIVSLVFVSRGSGGQFAQVGICDEANYSWTQVDMLDAPTGVTTLGGVPFDISSNGLGYEAWAAGYVPGVGDGQLTLSIDVGVYGVTDVYTLINTHAGASGPDSYASLVFTGSGGATYTKHLVGNEDIRDYYPNIYTNLINGTTTTQVFWSAYNDERLDMQHIVLPFEFATQTLTTIVLVDDGRPYFQRTVLDGVTVQYVPEPSILALIGIGAFGMLAFVWQRRRAS
ncbi:MAG: PEP-CTERM sorting domain-containing protein [Sedimentisphaerales bacterium]|nr:PEP-CTERM sorting domain-containing protein [Sedimentisphaerales bacterium]